MIKEDATSQRMLHTKQLSTQLVIAGGGLSGVCCAITAARSGLKVILVQDRPVLGGNSSSEVRLWVLGATSHMGNNNRWAREGGVIDELLVENMYRNQEGNALIFDTILLEKILEEPNIKLLLNTAVFEVTKTDPDTISGVSAFCSQNSTLYNIEAPLFCDASGDGIIGFLSGAAFRMGAESADEFDEKFAPSKAYGELLGHSMYFYTKDTGRAVKFVAPSFALTDITKIPRYKSFNTQEFGCRLWWIEYGGRLDTVHDTEQIKWELWKVIYGVWNHIKNSGLFPEAENLTLEWVGHIPGKRESRRFEGDYILSQKDIVEQREHPDAVAFGGWSIDLHPADGVFSEKPGCNQWHSKGIYQVPYRCLYSRNIQNLFLAGRIISTSHVAFGSSRVMATSAYIGQAVGMAAVIAADKNLLPRDLNDSHHLEMLQQSLTRAGQYIPGINIADENDLVRTATLRASSELTLQSFPANGDLFTLNVSAAQLIPFKQGDTVALVIHAWATEATDFQVELRVSSKKGNHTPDTILETKRFQLIKGKNCLSLNFETNIPSTGYAFIVFHKNELVQLPLTSKRVSGILSVFNITNKAVSNTGRQHSTEDIGVESFEFWIPQRRPAGHNFALDIKSPGHAFSVDNLINGVARPTHKPNAWVADWNDRTPTITITWEAAQKLSTIELSFDTDFDHPMESVLMLHPENIMPFCVRNYTIKDERGTVVFEKKDNHQTRNIIKLQNEIITSSLTIELEQPAPDIPVSLFEIRCYAT
jgi:hypothetical protein